MRFQKSGLFVFAATALLFPAIAHAAPAPAAANTVAHAAAGSTASVTDPPSAAAPVGPAEQPAPAVTPERSAKNSIYAEGLGSGLFYSINYDRAVGDFAARVGIGYVSLSASSGDGQVGASASMTAIPLTVSYLGIGSQKHMFEIGGGATVLHMSAGAHALGVESDASATTAIGTLIFGYRLQPPDGGFLFRAGISPVFGHGIFLPWPYLALGGTF